MLMTLCILFIISWIVFPIWFMRMMFKDLIFVIRKMCEKKPPDREEHDTVTYTGEMMKQLFATVERAFRRWRLSP
jgi:hypothetical protein